MSRVILFGGGLQSLSISRGLKDYNHYVINLADRQAVGKYGKFVDSFIPIELNNFTAKAFARIIKETTTDVVIPMEDEYAEWLSLNKEAIESISDTKLAVVEHLLFQRVINKCLLLSECKKSGIPHPKTESLHIDKIHEIAENLCFPALIKPDVSNGSRGITRVDTTEEFLAKAPAIIAAYGDCTVQEFIEQSHYYNVMLYRYKDGSWGQHVVTKITRYYPIKGGSSSFCTTIYGSDIIRPCMKLLEHLGWTGFADFDVLEKGEGDYRIIEINPRVPASVHAAYVSGVNYGEMIVADMIENRKIDSTYNPGRHLRFIGLDIAWFLASPDRFKASPSWFRFIGKNIYYQEGGFRDLKAMLYSIFVGIKKQLSPSFRKSKSGMN